MGNSESGISAVQFCESPVLSIIRNRFDVLSWPISADKLFPAHGIVKSIGHEKVTIYIGMEMVDEQIVADQTVWGSFFKNSLNWQQRDGKFGGQPVDYLIEFFRSAKTQAIQILCLVVGRPRFIIIAVTFQHARLFKDALRRRKRFTLNGNKRLLIPGVAD